ncbi:MAG: hypothetical protein JST01_03555 [Cyanobacteria bacterium SZAS TMP-1]|nr:hypothetical protein [Cyanobacteria bacterium SZAS TMP-1]
MSSKKDFWKHELRELSIIFSYLFVCFSVLSTIKALVLLQHDVTDLGHMYGVSAVEAIALGKIVALAQNLPLMNACDKRPMWVAVLYKSVWMTVMVNIGGTLEEKLFHHHAAESAHPWLLFISHQLAFLFIFAVLFLVRELDRALGPKKLVHIVFGNRE